MSEIAKAMNEYGSAVRGDWSDLDGRSVRDVMEMFASAVEGGPEAAWSIGQWRAALGICPDGGCHWGGKWSGYCETDEGCPSLRDGAGL